MRSDQDRAMKPSRTLGTLLTLAAPVAAFSFAADSALAQPGPAAGATAGELAEIRSALGSDGAAVGGASLPRSPPLPAPVARAVSSFNPSLSFMADFALAAFSTKSPRQAGGHDPNQ